MNPDKLIMGGLLVLVLLVGGALCYAWLELLKLL